MLEKGSIFKYFKEIEGKARCHLALKGNKRVREREKKRCGLDAGWWSALHKNVRFYMDGERRLMTKQKEALIRLRKL